MTVDLVSFERPDRLMSMNDRVHWSKARRRARAWREAAAWSAIAQLGPLLEDRLRPPSVVTVTLPVHGALRRDPHNFFLTVKHIVDGLVDAGLWPDDTPEWVTTTEPRLELSDDPIGVVAISITSREPMTKDQP